MKRSVDNPRLVLRELLRRDFGAFLRKAYPWVKGGELLDWNWHLAAIVFQLNLVAAGKQHRLAITMPPRSLKTFTISVAWVAWMLGHSPRRNFVCVSYAGDLAAGFGRECQLIMQSPWYRDLFPDTIISAKRSAAHDFQTTRGGGRLATSITGTLTGRGGDFIIIDDPIKPDEVASETTREAVNTWYKTTLSSRLNNKALGSIVLVMQRLHERDLAGVLLATGRWSQLKLQAIATEDQRIALPRGKVYRRAAGELLHPAREPQHVLDELRASMGSVAFTAQYQQDPLPAVGNVVLLRWLKEYEPTFDPARSSGQIVQSWDCAGKDGPTNDFSVCITAHINRREVRVLHVFRDRLAFPALRDTAYRLAREHQARDLLIEDHALGTPLIQAFGADRPYGVPMPIPCRPEGDKISRMQGISGQIEAGQLLLPHEASWLPEFKAELLGFPNVPHDDQCDALSQLMNWVQRREAMLRDDTPIVGPELVGGDDGSTWSDDYYGERGLSHEAEKRLGIDHTDPWLD